MVDRGALPFNVLPFGLRVASELELEIAGGI